MAALISLALSLAAGAKAEDTPRCRSDGYISDRLVPTPEVAKAIYKAVALGLSPSVFKEYPIIVVEDEGDHWVVSQTNNEPPPVAKPNEVIVTTGGGQLGMYIDKCSGAVSHAAFAR